MVVGSGMGSLGPFLSLGCPWAGCGVGHGVYGVIVGMGLSLGCLWGQGQDLQGGCGVRDGVSGLLLGTGLSSG